VLRGVLFDLDGVLLDSYEAWFALVNAAARDLGYPPVSREDFDAGWGQGIAADVESFFVRHDVAAIEAYYRTHFAEHARELTVDPEAAPLLEALRRAGLRVGVVTNTPASIAAEILRAAGLRADVLVGGTDVPRAKPAPGGRREAGAPGRRQRLARPLSPGAS
jgi:phosphoglycolate phosphatase-like HAD superfamily hydrolase